MEQWTGEKLKRWLISFVWWRILFACYKKRKENMQNRRVYWWIAHVLDKTRHIKHSHTHTQNPYNTYEQQHRHLAKHLNVYKYTRDVTRTWSKATFVVSSCLTIFVVCFNERHCYAITKTFVYMFFGIHVTKHNVYTSNTLCLLLLDLWCFVYIFWTRKLSNPFDCVNILWCRCIHTLRITVKLVLYLSNISIVVSVT